MCVKTSTELTLAAARGRSAQDYIVIQLPLCLQSCEYKVDHASDSAGKPILVMNAFICLLKNYWGTWVA